MPATVQVRSRFGSIFSTLCELQPAGRPVILMGRPAGDSLYACFSPNSRRYSRDYIYKQGQMSRDLEKVLVLAKEATARSCLRRTLEALGFDVGEAPNGENALRRMRMVDYEAILLECRVFGSDWAAVCKQFRIFDPRLPILVVTSNCSLMKKVSAFEAGVDDYMTRPVSERELAARLRSAIRRFHANVGGIAERSVVGDIVLDPVRHRVEKAGSEVPLTPTEFRALKLLMQQPGIPISYSTLLAEIWGQGSRANREHLRVVISTLRKKLEDNPSEPRYLTTNAYFGYCLEIVKAGAYRRRKCTKLGPLRGSGVTGWRSIIRPVVLKHYTSHGKEVETKHLLLSFRTAGKACESRASLCAENGMLREKRSAIAVVRILDRKRIASFCNITLTSRVVGIIKLQFSRNTRSIATTWPDGPRTR
jgi:two-component system, OmpR family, KDP operon response regulator KdpE